MGKPLRLPGTSEQAVLDELVVELIKPQEKPRWDELIVEHHYLKNAVLVGEQLHYAAQYRQQWVALLGWSGPALHLKGREAWLGWSVEQLRSRRHFLAQNSRFVLLCDRLELPNLATRALGLCCQRLSTDWLEVHGHPILAVESFVDGQLFRGTSYKAAGWTMLGPTSGFGRCAEDFYQRHDRPKQLWVRALDLQGTAHLKAQELPPALAQYERPAAVRCHVPISHLPSLLERLPAIREPRKCQGRYQPWPAILGILCLAKLAGVPGSQDDVAAFAKRLTQAQRRQLGCWRDPKTGRREVPSRSTFFRALKAVDYLALEKTLLDWQNDLLGQPEAKELVVLDGKVLHGTQGQTVLNAVTVPSGRVLGVELVRRADPQLTGQDSPVSTAKHGAENEIPAARRLLSRLDLAGSLVSLDAMHTQHETAAQVVLEAGADYLLTLKDNQPTMLQSAQTLVKGDFFPPDPLTQKERTARTEEKNRGRLEIRQLVSREIQPAQLGLIGARQVARLDKERTHKGQTAKTQMWLTTSAATQELPPLALLTARRQEWGIETGLHYVLDVSGDEDRRLKSRTPNCLWVLSLLSRLSVALWKRSRKNRQSYYRWREDQKSRCNWLLQLMRTAPAKVKW